jgi:hypothetical protein
MLGSCLADAGAAACGRLVVSSPPWAITRAVDEGEKFHASGSPDDLAPVGSATNLSPRTELLSLGCRRDRRLSRWPLSRTGMVLDRQRRLSLFARRQVIRSILRFEPG